MDKGSVIGDGAIGSDEGVGGDGLTENFDSKGVDDDFFCFFGDIGVNEGDVVVGSDDITKGGKAFFYSLDNDVVGERVTNVF